MNPLRASQSLSVIEKWDSFRPSRKGYLPPAALTLDCTDVAAQIHNYTDPTYTDSGEAISELRDAFRVWRHGLTRGDPEMPPAVVVWTAMFQGKVSTSKLEGSEEGRLLRHLAPVAKAYGFKICFGHVNHGTSCEHKIDHEYKQYDDWYDELDAEDLEMVDPEVDCDWTFHDLSGKKTNVTVADLGAALESQIVEAAEDEDVDDVGIECVDDGIYQGTVRLTHRRQYTFLLILPA